jgi:hypothetical protein
MTDEEKIRIVEILIDGAILTCSQDIFSTWCDTPSGKVFKSRGHLVMPCSYHLSCYNHLEEVKEEK